MRLLRVPRRRNAAISGGRGAHGTHGHEGAFLRTALLVPGETALSLVGAKVGTIARVLLLLLEERLGSSIRETRLAERTVGIIEEEVVACTGGRRAA